MARPILALGELTGWGWGGGRSQRPREKPLCREHEELQGALADTPEEATCELGFEVGENGKRSQQTGRPGGAGEVTGEVEGHSEQGLLPSTGHCKRTHGEPSTWMVRRNE